MPLAAVTGGTGFLGRRLVPALAAAGWRVRALSRLAPAPNLWGAAEAEVMAGDLSDAASLAALTAGADVVIHMAGLIKARNRAAFLDANEGGARRLAEASGGAPMILVSSLAAREPQLSDYAASKRAGEDAAGAVLGERLTVLRPPAIYGPGDRETLGLFRLVAASPLLVLPGPDDARLALAHVDDVVAAILAQAAAPTPGVFAVPGARPGGYGWREIFTAAAGAVAARPRLVPLAPWMVRTAGAAAEFGGTFLRDPPIFNRGKAREILHPDWTVAPTEQAPRAPTARFDLDAGFADTVAWYRREGWLR